jgi:hypothetical protein
MMLREAQKTPSQIAKYFQFTLQTLPMPVKIQLDSGPVNEHKQGESRFNSVNKGAMSDEK